MANSKNDDKKTNQEDVKARPQHQGKDPLAGGERLYNDQNTESATHYRSDESELKAERSPSQVAKDQEKADAESRERDEQMSQTVNDQAKLDTVDTSQADDQGTKADLVPPTGANREAAKHNATADLSQKDSLEANKSTPDAADKPGKPADK
ncbi:MAG TPA: hypothetical protein VD907_06905 [Verrucomicrobiae bacterium]|nr:hypothetical protein [Verrucomicrobiae bacterium]